MKTAVSLPDDVFHGAERHARRTRKSRSQLYAEALTEYLVRHAPDDVTEAMDAAVERVGVAASDPFIRTAARRILRNVEW
jgi:metal-responsive CopG/Arc/MetJ family transcriptional regulator